jgi:hypothetical protein
MGGRKQAKNAIRSKFTVAREVEWIAGEDYRDRHLRRYNAAADARDVVLAWCEHRSVSLSWREENRKPYWSWKFTFPDKFAVWYPYTGKLCLKRKLRDPDYHVMKVHEHHQLLIALEWWLS